jgi:hypothetical protein
MFVQNAINIILFAHNVCISALPKLNFDINLCYNLYIIKRINYLFIIN